MKKVILGVAISLDGFIEGPKGEYDWCPPPSGKEMNAFMDSVDTIFFGRKSFELMGPTAFPNKNCYVFSNSLQTVKGKNVELVAGDVAGKVKNIKNTSGKNIWLFGGASLTTTFINEGLVDELWLGVVPIVLGSGKPLFQNIQQRTHFKLIDSVAKNGYLSVRYSLKT